MTLRPRLAAGSALLALALTALVARAEGPAAAADPWERLPGILEGIRAPTFPDRDFPVTDVRRRRGWPDRRQRRLPRRDRGLRTAAAAGGSSFRPASSSPAPST